MKFDFEANLDKVKSGTKTVTRWPLNKKAIKFAFDGPVIKQVFQDEKPILEVGRQYDVISGEDGKPEGKIRVLCIEVDPNPGYMKIDDARVEGFDTPDQFKADFVEKYGDTALWRPALKVEFAYLKKEEKAKKDSTESATQPAEDLEIAPPSADASGAMSPDRLDGDPARNEIASSAALPRNDKEVSEPKKITDPASAGAALPRNDKGGGDGEIPSRPTPPSASGAAKPPEVS